MIIIMLFWRHLHVECSTQGNAGLEINTYQSGIGVNCMECLVTLSLSCCNVITSSSCPNFGSIAAVSSLYIRTQCNKKYKFVQIV